MQLKHALCAEGQRLGAGSGQAMDANGGERDVPI